MTNLTFGICISPLTDSDYLFRQLVSIYNIAKTIKYSEVILVGEPAPHIEQMMATFSNGLSIKLLRYEHESGKAHITKKKNIIAGLAAYENLTIAHDYYEWPEDFAVHLPEKYDIYCVPIQTLEGARHSDWVLNPNKVQSFLDANPHFNEVMQQAAPHEPPKYVCGLPYHVPYMWKAQYVSGGLITCKTEVLQAIPFNEDLFWGDAEDVEWSERLVLTHKLVCKGWRYDVGPARVLKPNKWAVTEIPSEVLRELRFYYDGI